MALLTARPSAAARRVRRWIVALAFALGGLRADAADTAPPAAISSEYQIKAVFLFNFAQFAEWPERVFPQVNSPLVIGVLGEDPFGTYLDELVRDEKIGKRPLVVRRYRDPGRATDCHILFMSRSESERLESIVNALRRESILTISDADSFTRVGGMVRFVMENGKVRLRINVEAARASGVTISSKILRPATIVTTGKD